MDINFHVFTKSLKYGKSDREVFYYVLGLHNYWKIWKGFQSQINFVIKMREC